MGCSKSDLISPPVGKEMGFSTHVSSTTKGVVKSDFAIGDQFAVMATESAVAWSATDATWYMGGGADSYVTVTNSQRGDASAWTYNPIKLWPDVNKVSFFAFSPVATLTNGISNVQAVTGAPTLDFEVNNDIKNQIDLLRAESLDKYDEEVQLAFSHALSRISFAAKANVSSSQRVRLDKIELKGIKNKGVLKLYDQDRVIGSLEDMGGWSGQAGDVNYVPALTHEVASLVTTDLMPMTAEDQALFMIPQEFAANGAATLDVVYSYSNDGGKKWVNNASFSINLSEYTQYWNPGKSYRYVLTLSPDKVYSFGADIIDWNDELDVLVKNPFSTASLAIDPTGGLPTELVVTETRGQALSYTLKSSDAAWLTIATVADGSDGKGEITYNADGTITTKADYETEKKFYVVTKPNTTGTERAANITLARAGMADLVLPVTQAGSNPFKDCAVLAEQEPAEAIVEVEKMTVSNAAGLTHKLKTEADWFTMSSDGVAANAKKELTLDATKNDATGQQSFYVHINPNKNVAAREGFVVFETTNPQGVSLDVGRFKVKQKAVPQPFAAAVASPTIHYSDGKTQISKMATSVGVEYTLTGTNGATLSLDGVGNGAATLTFTAAATQSSFYLHYTENPSTTAARDLVSVDVTGATKLARQQPARIGNRVGRFAGTLKTETVGAETHYYYNATLYAATADETGLAWATTNSTTGATDRMDGKANSAKLQGTGYPAANACNTKSPAGYYLPAQNQLTGIWIAKPVLGTFASGNYWASVENDAYYSWCVYFITGGTYTNTKTDPTNFTRCVRDVTN